MWKTRENLRLGGLCAHDIQIQAALACHGAAQEHTVPQPTQQQPLSAGVKAVSEAQRIRWAKMKPLFLGRLSKRATTARPYCAWADHLLPRACVTWTGTIQGVTRPLLLEVLRSVTAAGRVVSGGLTCPTHKLKKCVYISSLVKIKNQYEGVGDICWNFFLFPQSRPC